MRANGQDGPGDGLQLESMRRRNAAAVLGTVRAQGPLARSEIAAAVGLSPTAVTKITADLIKAGIIREAPEDNPGLRSPGRPRVPVELDPSRHRFLGVHIGLRRITVGLVDLAGRVVTQRFRSHTSARPEAVLGMARRLVRELQQPDVAVLGYGVCCGGWVSPGDGVVREFPGLGWHDVPLRDGLRMDGLPEPVVESSVRALALAEARIGAAQGVDNVLYLFVGNVMGCAHVLHGQIARGRQSAAGTIDHLTASGGPGMTCSCGRRDCLWAVASDAALLHAATRTGHLASDAHIEDLVDLSHSAGPAAERAAHLLAERSRDVGTALGGLLDLFDPGVVVVGGGVRLAIEHFPALVAAAHERTALPHDLTPVLPAALAGPDALVGGAATPALDAFYDDPLAARATSGG